MEEEGIYYWFEQQEKKHVLIDERREVRCTFRSKGTADLTFHEVTGEEPDWEHIYKFRYVQEVRPGRSGSSRL